MRGKRSSRGDRRRTGPAERIVRLSTTTLAVHRTVILTLRVAQELQQSTDVTETDLAWILRRQHDVISRRQVLRHLTEATVRRHLYNGRWQVPHRGIYVTHNGPLTRQQQMWVGLLAAGAGEPRLAVAGLSALELDGFSGFASSKLEIYLPDRLRIHRVPDYVRIRRIKSIAPVDLMDRAWPPRTTSARSAVDAARWSPSPNRARAIITAVVQQRLATPADLLDAAFRLSRMAHRALIFATIHDAAGGSESIHEQDFLGLCRRGRLPEPSRQSVVTSADGRARYRDAFFEEWNLHVEIDGSHHMDARNWWADMQRQNAMWTPGVRVLRFPAWAIRNQPEMVIATIRRALIEAGWRPSEDKIPPGKIRRTGRQSRRSSTADGFRRNTGNRLR